MKRSAYYYLSFAAIMTGCLVSCQDDNQGFTEEEVHDAAVKRQYAKNFEDRYGKIDPTHTWGFGTVSVPFNPIEGTRAGTNVAVKDEMDWLTKYDVLPPGANQAWLDHNQNGINRAGDLGDVTKDEILFVSEFFRTYNKTQFDDPSTVYSQPSGLISAEQVELHLTDYFIQNISKDVDRVNENNEPDYPNGSHVRSNPCTTHFSMDQLRSLPYGRDKANFDNWDHINDFNSGNTYSVFNNDPSVLDGDGIKNYKKLMYVHSSGTEAFGYHPSDNTTSHYYSSYVLMHLKFTVNGRTYEGTYLGFDYECEKGTNTVTTKDGYHSNWIVKISGVEFIPSGDFPCRIMCEDLGNTLDFDFNDVVFDLKYEVITETNIEAIITLRASGGTLPIYVGNNNADFEAHRMLGQNTYEKPVNVGGTNGVSHAVAIYRIKWPNAKKVGNNVEVDPDDIPIWVNTSKSTANVNEFILLKKDDPNAAYSAAPQKICIPDVTTKWLKENQQIEWGYGYFNDWVKDKSSHNFGATDAWNTTHKAESCAPQKGLETSYLY